MGDFRDETIYFVMTTRFYDGDSSNNVHCWDDKKAEIQIETQLGEEILKVL